MKKLVAMMLVVLTVLSVSVLFASASETPEVYVTISDKDGKTAVAAEKVAVTDIDGDNALTINDALYAAHEKFYEGGAAAGYGSEMHKTYGLSLTKLWGDTSRNFSYQLNNGDPVWNLAQPIKANDYIAAYIYRDTKYWSDIYLFFDRIADKDVEPGEVALTLKQLGFDASYNTVQLPMEGAELTVDGEPTGVITDAEGKATLELEEPGDHIVSATAAGKITVAPVYRINIVGEEPEATPDEGEPTEPETVNDATEPEVTAPAATIAPTEKPATADSATKDTATKDSSGTPNTGDNTNLWLWVLIAGLCLCGVIGAVVVYKKNYAKK